MCFSHDMEGEDNPVSSMKQALWPENTSFHDREGALSQYLGNHWLYRGTLFHFLVYCCWPLRAKPFRSNSSGYFVFNLYLKPLFFLISVDARKLISQRSWPIFSVRQFVVYKTRRLKQVVWGGKCSLVWCWERWQCNAICRYARPTQQLCYCILVVFYGKTHSTAVFHSAVFHVNELICNFLLLLLPSTTLIKLTRIRQVLPVCTRPDSLWNTFSWCSWLAKGPKS